MVFKIISVGSIPAILDIFLFSLMKPNSHINSKLPKQTTLVKQIRPTISPSLRRRRRLLSKGSVPLITEAGVHNTYNVNKTLRRANSLFREIIAPWSYYIFLFKEQSDINQIRGKLVLDPHAKVFFNNAKIQGLHSGTPVINAYRRKSLSLSLVHSGGCLNQRNNVSFYSGTQYLVPNNNDFNDLINVFASITYIRSVNYVFQLSFFKKLLGIYLVNADYFNSTPTYFPSIEHVKTFQNVFFDKIPNTFHLHGFFKKPLLFNNQKLFLRKSHNINAVELNMFPKTHKFNTNLNVIKAQSQLLRLFILLISNYSTIALKYHVKKVSKLFAKFFKNNWYKKRYTFTQFDRFNLFHRKHIQNRKKHKLVTKRLQVIKDVVGVYNNFHRKSTIGLYQHQEKHITLKDTQINKTVVAFRSNSLYFLQTAKMLLSKKIFFFSNLSFFPFTTKLLYYFFKNETLKAQLKNHTTNLVPESSYFNKKISKYMHSARLNYTFRENVTSWVFNTLIRFMEFYSGRRISIELYSFMDQSIDLSYLVFYKSWLPRFSYYERRLGHRFFLEESLHILHMGFTYQDSKLISSWLKSLILRISFWKTRFIFRFIKYLFNNYFQYIFPEIGVKGFKVKLKGKISVAGNSRKRCILYRVGKTSHATIGLKVVHTADTIVTFTGVMGFQIWIFY